MKSVRMQAFEKLIQHSNKSLESKKFDPYSRKLYDIMGKLTFIQLFLSLSGKMNENLDLDLNLQRGISFHRVPADEEERKYFRRLKEVLFAFQILHR